MSPSAVPGVLSRRLDNGTRVLLIPTAKPPRGYRGVACVQLWVGAGAADERAREHGCAHLFEHMVFKPQLDAHGQTRDLASTVEQLGGDINAFTSHDETVFHATAPGDVVLDVLDVLLPFVTAATIDPELLAREKEVVIEEIRQYEDDPSARSLQALMADLYGEHPYARPVLGELAEVESLTPARLRGWQRRQCRGDRLTVVVAGPVDPATVESRVRAHLGALPGPKTKAKTKAKAKRPAAVPPRTARVRVERCDVQEVYVRLGWLGGTALEPEGVALDVAAVALGQGESSRLAVQVRRRGQLVSDAHASYLAGLASGAFLVSAQTELETAETAILALLEHTEALALRPLATEEFERARALLQSSLIYRRESVQGQAHALGYYAAASGDPGAEQAYFDTLAALDPERVRAACARSLLREHGAITVYLPEATTKARDATALARSLRQHFQAKRRKRHSLRFSKAKRDDFGTLHARHDSGLRVVARPDASVPVVGAWLVWPGGLRVETPRSAGVSSLTAALLNRGTSSRSGDGLAREVEGLAAVIDGFAGHNSVGLQAESLSQHFPAILERTIDCAIDPLFDEEEFEEARRIAHADLEADRDDPGYLAYRTMLASLYGRHPLGRDLRGTLDSLAKLDRTKIARNWTRRYGLGQAVLAVAGDLEFGALLATLDGLLADLPAADALPRGSQALNWPGGPPKWPRKPITHTLERAREQGQLVIGFPGLAIGDPRGPILDVLNSVLGGQAGRLFEALREREGLVYQVSASAGEHIDGGHVVVHAAASQDKLPAAHAAVLRELEGVSSALISAAELERAKRWLIGQFESAMQRRSRVASRMVFAETYGLGVNYYLTYPARVQAVTRPQVLALARELLDPARRVTVTVTAS